MAESVGLMHATPIGETAARVRVTTHKLYELESQRLTSEIDAYLTKGEIRSVLLDLSDVEYISSAGLGALITIGKKVSEHGGRYALANVSSETLKVIKLTRLDKLLKIVKDDAKGEKYVTQR